MSTLTLYIAKVLGLYLIAIAVAMMIHRRAVVAAIDAWIVQPPLMLFMEVITLGIGLAMVVGHQIWSGGALALVVTLAGWSALLKGAIFLFAGQERTVQLYKALRFDKYFNAYMGVSLALGLYLTLAAFAA